MFPCPSTLLDGGVCRKGKWIIMSFRLCLGCRVGGWCMNGKTWVLVYLNSCPSPACLLGEGVFENGVLVLYFF